MNRIELPEPTQAGGVQIWHVGRATTEPFTGREVWLHYSRSGPDNTPVWLIVIVGFTGLESRRETRKTASGVRGRLGKLFDAQAVHLTGWVR